MRASRALLLAGFALVGCGGSPDRGSDPGQPVRTISGYAMTMTLPPGWYGRVYRLSPEYAITVQAATVPLPRPGDDEMLIARKMKPGDAYLVINDIGPPPPGLGREPVWDLDPSLPLAVQRADVGGPWEGGFPAGAALNVVVNGRSLMIRVRFGSNSPGEELDQVNSLLSTLSVGPLDTDN